MGKIYSDITKTIGNTPLVRLNRVTLGLDATVLVKLESFNPLGSVKDRIGMAMIEDAEKRGVLKKGTIIIEPTSGNTGIALAMICAVRGYRFRAVMPESATPERVQQISMYGAEIVFSGSVLLELARRGVSREQAYEWVQRNAMRAFHEQRSFKDLLLADADVTGVLDAVEVERAFDLDEQLKHVTDVFDRVFSAPIVTAGAGF